MVRLPDDVWSTIKCYMLPVRRWAMLADKDDTYKRAFKSLAPSRRAVVDVLNSNFPPDAVDVLKEWWAREDVRRKTPVDVAPLLDRDEFRPAALWNWFRVLDMRMLSVDWEVVQAYVTCIDPDKTAHVEAVWDRIKPPFVCDENVDVSRHIFDVMRSAQTPQQMGFGLGMVAGGGRNTDVWVIVHQTAQHIISVPMSAIDDTTVEVMRKLLVSGALVPAVRRQLLAQARHSGRTDWAAELELSLCGRVFIL